MESLNGQLLASPVAVSWGKDRIDVFAPGVGNTPWQWIWNGVVWVGPAPLPFGANIPAARLAAISLGPNRLDVFAAGPGNTPWWWRWSGASWSLPQSLPQGGNLPAEALGVTSSGPDLLDVFGAGAGNNPWWWHWNGSSWSVPQMLPAGANLPAEGVAVVSARPNRLDVFAPGQGNNLWHWAHEGPAPWTVENIGGNVPSEGVSAISSGPSRIDVFAASRGGSGNPLQHWWWDGARFLGPETLAGNLTAAAVSAVTSGANRMDVFGVAGDGNLVRWQWDGSSWLGPNPRGLNLPAGDVTAVASGPGRIDVFARGANNTLQHWPGGGLPACSVTPWTNFAHNHSVLAPAGHCQPGSLSELVAIVKQAEQLGRRVRAVGSSWSFSDIAVTDGYIVETKMLNSVLTEVLEASPSIMNSRAAGLNLVHVEAGITLVDLNNMLDRRDLALRTMGGASGQTLAGAVSTCVHGADIDRGPLPDSVRAIHLVGPGGVQHWIEPTDGITDPAGLAAALSLDPANIHYDDDWFNSVLVSMGSLGIIYSLVIEVVGQYDLVEDTTHLNWEALRPMLASGDVFTGQRAVLVAINPFKVPDSTGTLTHPCYLSTRNEAPPTPPSPGTGGGGMAQLWQWLGPLISFALNNNPNGIETTVTAVTDSSLPQGRKQGIGHTIMATSDPPPAPGLGLEIAFDATDNAYLGFVDEALQILETAYQRDHLAFGGWFSLRFVGQSRAYLSPQHKSTRTCMVEMAGLGALSSTKPILDLIEAAGQRHGGIQHWGMFSTLGAADVRIAYKDLDKWLSIRSRLTNKGALRTFDNGFDERCGLTRPPIAQSSRTKFSDYDGDGKSDYAVWRPNNGTWFEIHSSDGAQLAQQWGEPGDIPVPGDYDGDRKGDLAVWRPSTGEWWVTRSLDGAQSSRTWGLAGDIPIAGDFDGDGKTDLAVWRPSTGEWWVIRSSDDAQTTQQWGQAGDVPVPGDYDGDGKTDFAVWRPSDGVWYVIRSSDGVQTTQQWGQAGDIPVPGNYDWDLKTDYAVWRPSSGVWWGINSSDGGQTNRQWGQDGDIPVPGDYDADGRTDWAIWRPSTGEWWTIHSSDGAQANQQWGQVGDVPLSAR